MENKPSTEQLLELLKYYDADRLRTLQTQLTKAGKQIQEVSDGKLAALFSADELDTLRQAATLLAGLKNRIERAKEAKAAAEKRAEQERAAFLRAAQATLNQALPMAEGSPEDRLDLVRWALFLTDLRMFYSYRSAAETHKELLADFDDAWAYDAQKTLGAKAPPAPKGHFSILGFFNVLRRDLVSALDNHLPTHRADFGATFQTLQQRYEAALPELNARHQVFLAHIRHRLLEEAASQNFLKSVTSTLGAAVPKDHGSPDEQ